MYPKTVHKFFFFLIKIIPILKRRSINRNIFQFLSSYTEQNKNISILYSVTDSFHYYKKMKSFNNITYRLYTYNIIFHTETNYSKYVV